MDLESIRKEIDNIDDEILSLFLRRMELSNLAIEEKINTGKNLRDKTRENQIIQDIVKKSGDYANYSKILFETIMSLSRHRQAHLLKIDFNNSNYYKNFNLDDLCKDEINYFINLWNSLEE